MYVIPAIKRRKTVYFGHMIRKDNIQRVLVDGQVQGKRGRGQQIYRYTTKNLMGNKYI